MGSFVHRITFQQLNSTDPNSLPESVSNYVEGPDLSPVVGVPRIYWVLTGDIFSEMGPAAKSAVDIVLENAKFDSIADELDAIETITKAFAEVVLDELNTHSLQINEVLSAIEGASNFNQVKANFSAITGSTPRTLAELKTAVRGKL